MDEREHDLDAERQLLGNLAGPFRMRCQALVEFLRVEDFTTAEHRGALFAVKGEHGVELSAEEAVALREFLDLSNGWLSAAASVPSQNLKALAHRVIHCSTNRNAASTAIKFEQTVARGGNIAAAMEKMEREMERLTVRAAEAKRILDGINSIV